MGGLYKAFTELDCSLIEINPLVVTGAGDVIALDAKMNFDDNALYRHKDLEALRDLDEEDPAETEAAKYALNYVKLDGQIGCMVNGAGLAMATMDIIKLYGAAPANFLDVGGGATKERVTAAFKIILKDPNVEGILVNIFGGIMRCDVIAEGVVAAAREVNLHVPLVVRLEGTNVELGKKILKESGLKITSAENLADAAREDRPGRQGGQLMAVLVDKNTKVICQGFTGSAGHLPFRAGDRLRHQDGGRRDAGQRRHHPSRPAGVRHRGRGRRQDRRDRDRDLRAGGLRRRFDPRGDRRRDPADRLHHRGHPGARHGQGEARARRLEVAPDRAQLPGRHHARRMQDRHHAGPHPQARQDRHHLALRHAHLRGGGADHGGRPRPDDLHRHRRRSGERHQLRRVPGDAAAPIPRPRASS